jgi:hypothetical protein
MTVQSIDRRQPNQESGFLATDVHTVLDLFDAIYRVCQFGKDVADKKPHGDIEPNISGLPFIQRQSQFPVDFGRRQNLIISRFLVQIKKPLGTAFPITSLFRNMMHLLHSKDSRQTILTQPMPSLYRHHQSYAMSIS